MRSPFLVVYLLAAAAFASQPGRAAADAQDDAREEFGRSCALAEAAEKAQSAELEQLLSEGRDPNIDSCGVPLCRAVEAGRADNVELLLKWKADVEGGETGCRKERSKVDFASPLALAAQLGNMKIVDLLLARRAKLRFGERGATALHAAVYASGDAAVRRLLSAHVPVDALDPNDATPLVLAAGAGNLAAVRALLEARANPNVVPNAGPPALVAAATADQPEIVVALLKAGAQPNLAHGNNTPLMAAAEASSPAAVRALLAAGADANLAGYERMTALTIAVRKRISSRSEQTLAVVAALLAATKDAGALWKALPAGDWPLARLLASRPELLKNGDPDGRPVLQAAVTYHAPADLIEELVRAGADPNAKDANGRTPLCYPPDARVTAALLSAGARPNEVDASGATLLLANVDPSSVSDADSVAIVEKLLAAGAEPNRADNHGRTPLLEALEKKHDDVARLLIRSGKVDFTTADEEGQTALMAVQTLELAKLMVGAGARVDARSPNGRTPLTRAQNAEILEYYLSTGADPTQTENDRWTPLRRAVLLGAKASVVKQLLDRGAKLDVVSRGHEGEEFTELLEAVNQGNAELASLLLKAGANPNARAKYERGGGFGPGEMITVTPLSTAVWQANVAMVSLLLAAGADVNGKTGHGGTPLHEAAVRERDVGAIIDALLAKGARLEDRNDDGDTALLLAAREAPMATLQKLLDAGADVAATDRKGRTPLDRARDGFRCDEVQALLARKAPAGRSTAQRRFPQASARSLGPCEVELYSLEELKTMRNEIFAAHGRVFPDKQWKDYFAKQAWYKARPAYKISLTEDEKRNLELIDTEEKRRAPK